MDETIKLLNDGWRDYISAAVDPLHHLSWQTASLFLILVLSGALIALWVARASWRFSEPFMKDIQIKRVPHTYKDHIRVNPKTYMEFHKRNVDLGLRSDGVQRDRAKDASRYYVVTVVEKGSFVPLVSKEMHLHFAMGRFTVAEKFVQFDEASLNDVRLGNSTESDDEVGTDIAGLYNIYIRRVAWYDVRHWLMHPNREIRIIIWVTIITTMLPMLKDFLFG